MLSCKNSRDCPWLLVVRKGGCTWQGLALNYIVAVKILCQLTSCCHKFMPRTVVTVLLERETNRTHSRSVTLSKLNAKTR